MPEFPTLETPRLVLRAFTLADAPAVQILAADRDIASTTLNIPHPYPEGLAESWISTHGPAFESGRFVSFAITRRTDGILLGAMGLHPVPPHQRAELGYWIGKPYWGQGYASEAGHAVVRYGFTGLGLNRIYAYHMTRNPASGRVMQKIGMTHEGHLRQHDEKWGVFEDVELYGILRSDLEASAAKAPPETIPDP